MRMLCAQCLLSFETASRTASVRVRRPTTSKSSENTLFFAPSRDCTIATRVRIRVCVCIRRTEVCVRACIWCVQVPVRLPKQRAVRRGVCLKKSFELLLTAALQTTPFARTIKFTTTAFHWVHRRKLHYHQSTTKCRRRRNCDKQTGVISNQ